MRVGDSVKRKENFIDRMKSDHKYYTSLKLEL